MKKVVSNISQDVQSISDDVVDNNWITDIEKYSKERSIPGGKCDMYKFPIRSPMIKPFFSKYQQY